MALPGAWGAPWGIALLGAWGAPCGAACGIPLPGTWGMLLDGACGVDLPGACGAWAEAVENQPHAAAAATTPNVRRNIDAVSSVAGIKPARRLGQSSSTGPKCP